MHMTDLMPKEKWAELEQELNERFRVNACAYDADGFTFTGFKKFANPLCPEVKAKPEGIQAICSVAHQNMAAQARSSRKTVIAECDAGLLKICTPVQLNGNFIGIVGGCGRLSQQGEVEPYVLKKAIDMPMEQCALLAAKVEPMDPQEVQRMVDFLEQRVAGILSAQPGA